MTVKCTSNVSASTSKEWSSIALSKRENVLNLQTRLVSYLFQDWVGIAAQHSTKPSSSFSQRKKIIEVPGLVPFHTL
jgi:hypothetical protein